MYAVSGFDEGKRPMVCLKVAGELDMRFSDNTFSKLFAHEQPLFYLFKEAHLQLSFQFQNTLLLVKNRRFAVPGTNWACIFKQHFIFLCVCLDYTVCCYLLMWHHPTKIRVLTNPALYEVPFQCVHMCITFAILVVVVFYLFLLLVSPYFFFWSHVVFSVFNMPFCFGDGFESTSTTGKAVCTFLLLLTVLLLPLCGIAVQQLFRVLLSLLQAIWTRYLEPEAIRLSWQSIH